MAPDITNTPGTIHDCTCGSQVVTVEGDLDTSKLNVICHSCKGRMPFVRVTATAYSANRYEFTMSYSTPDFSKLRWQEESPTLGPVSQDWNKHAERKYRSPYGPRKNGKRW